MLWKVPYKRYLIPFNSHSNSHSHLANEKQDRKNPVIYSRPYVWLMNGRVGTLVQAVYVSNAMLSGRPVFQIARDGTERHSSDWPPGWPRPEDKVNSSCFLGLQSCPALCDPIDCSVPGSSVLHYLPESVQTHTHWVYDAIQPSWPLSSPSSPALNLFQHQGLFKWVSSSHQVAKETDLL